ncbi:diadenosine hexaphosphate hydrolase [Filimonas sp.]|nr:diadenosine hexaphosphate hydrolase [Filimonas sp.]
MNMNMIKIILNNKRILLTEDYQAAMKQFTMTNAYITFNLTRQKASDIVDILMISEIQDAIIVGNIEKNLDTLKRSFRVITAGGGVVFNNRNELLFIYRRKKWDLPKGKLDRGESIEKCAVREVFEETGIRRPEIVRKLCNTYHLYLETSVILKETVWYLMFTETTWLKPQREEGIKKAVWVHKNNIRYQLRNTYPSIIDIFEVLLNEDN